MKLLVLFASLLLMTLGCDKVNHKQCIRATVVDKSCAGLVVVQVHNANIGSSWQYGGKTWDNVIAANLPNTIAVDSSVSFTLVRKAKNFDDVCGGESRACNMNIVPPDNIFCVKNVSAVKCSPADPY